MAQSGRGIQIPIQPAQSFLRCAFPQKHDDQFAREEVEGFGVAKKGSE